MLEEYLSLRGTSEYQDYELHYMAVKKTYLYFSNLVQLSTSFITDPRSSCRAKRTTLCPSIKSVFNDLLLIMNCYVHNGRIKEALLTLTDFQNKYINKAKR